LDNFPEVEVGALPEDTVEERCARAGQVPVFPLKARKVIPVTVSEGGGPEEQRSLFAKPLLPMDSGPVPAGDLEHRPLGVYPPGALERGLTSVTVARLSTIALRRIIRVSSSSKFHVLMT